MGLNITINGASYEDVPEMHAPLTDGSGMAKFYDTTERDAEESALITYANETTGASDETISDCIETLVSGYGSGGGGGITPYGTASGTFTLSEDYTATSNSVVLRLTDKTLCEEIGNRPGASILFFSAEAEGVDYIYKKYILCTSKSNAFLQGGFYMLNGIGYAGNRGVDFTQYFSNGDLCRVTLKASSSYTIPAGTYNVVCEMYDLPV